MGSVAKLKFEEELQRGHGRSIVALVNVLIAYAEDVRASDIHLDPEVEHLRVRFRVDGVLQDERPIPTEIHSEVISRIKILAGLRTDEHQAAQDGRFRLMLEGREPVDVRVSIVPTYYGENAVLRLLSDKAEEFTFETLGFSRDNQAKIRRAIARPYGMILATGPTGSGKTTTLYTLVKLLNTKEVSIITIEDPIEYAIDAIDQIQVNPRTALTFANGLRAVLRQDPNIIMVGEIRDKETAGLAVHTALTGHLLLSTVHTNDAATTLPRLLDMNIEPYLIASTVNIAIGQRLVRKICAGCKRERRVSAAELKSLRATLPLAARAVKLKFWQGAGCEACHGSGYRGRIGIQEVLVLDNVIREAVLRKTSASEIRQLAISQGMKTMVEDGVAKACAGVTTIEEVLRMLYE